MNKKDNKKANEMAMALLIHTLGFEHPNVIWFCTEVEKDPFMSPSKLTKLMVMALNIEDEDEE